MLLTRYTRTSKLLTKEFLEDREDRAKSRVLRRTLGESCDDANIDDWVCMLWTLEEMLVTGLNVESLLRVPTYTKKLITNELNIWGISDWIPSEGNNSSNLTLLKGKYM